MSSRIAQFTPFIGPHGLLRSSGQLRRLVEIYFDTNQPIVLDAVILSLNCSCSILIRRTIIRALITYDQRHRNVISCLNHVPQCVPSNQTASCVESTVQQPFNRSWPTSQKRESNNSLLPLTNNGVDYFGPFYVTVRWTTEKRWGFLFTFLNTRAVHVEVVPSTDNCSCVMVRERFVSRPGTPAMIW